MISPPKHGARGRTSLCMDTQYSPSAHREMGSQTHHPCSKTLELKPSVTTLPEVKQRGRKEKRYWFSSVEIMNEVQKICFLMNQPQLWNIPGSCGVGIPWYFNAEGKGVIRSIIPFWHKGPFMYRFWISAPLSQIRLCREAALV